MRETWKAAGVGLMVVLGRDLTFAGHRHFGGHGSKSRLRCVVAGT